MLPRTRPACFSVSLSGGGVLYSPCGSVVEAYAVATGALVATLRGHDGAVHALAEPLAALAQRLYSAAAHQTARAWSTAIREASTP